MASLYYVTSSSKKTPPVLKRRPRVPTNIPDVCRHNVYSRCAVVPPCDVTTGSQIPCDFSTCSSISHDHIAAQGDGFGGAYYDRMCELIDRQIELGTADRLCLVGDGGRIRLIATMLTERYCLIHPVVVVDTSSCNNDIRNEVRSNNSHLVNHIIDSLCNRCLHSYFAWIVDNSV